MSPDITITPEERGQRMSKALLRARAFVKMQGHDNTLCVTSGELFLFQDSLLSALEEQNKLHGMVKLLSEWCAQLESGHTLEEIGLALSNGMACPEPWQYADEAARRAGMAESEVNEDGPRG